jgi:hypothetical protein
MQLKTANRQIRPLTGCRLTGFKVKVKVNIMLRPTVSRPAFLCVKPHLGPKTRFLLLSFADLFMWGALSDERTGLSFTIAADPRQHSHIYRGQNQ